MIDLIGLPRFRMETHGREDVFISKAIEDWGNWETSNTALLLRMLGTAADFVDIGANIGWFTLVAAHALAGRGQVHSFEPDPAHLAKLRANVAANQLENVTINGCALSDRSGDAHLHLNAVNRGDNSLLPNAERTASTLVPLRRLDDYDQLGRARPLLIKLDVQGSEIDVLNGARTLLASYPHDLVLFCEVSPIALRAGGRRAAELAALLEELGFAAAVVDRVRPRVVPTSWRQLVEQVEDDDRRHPGTDCDIVAFRRIDGLMAPIFRPRGAS
ncbi:FkbM family methyltransferase [Devosia insulae]|nr:FkbM family methyltransferase [Devosia insulae]